MTAERLIPRGLIWVSLSPMFYGAMSVSAKLTGTHLSVWHLGTGRFGLGLFVIPVVVKALGLELWGQKRFLLTVRGLCGTASFLLVIAAFQMIPLSLAMIIFYLYPAFTALLSPWVAGEPTPKIAWLFICGSSIGISLILWQHAASGPLNLGHLFAGIASILVALILLLTRKLGKDNNVYTLFFYHCLVGTLVSLVPLLMQELPILPGQTSAWIGVAAVAVFSLCANLSLNQALTRISAVKVSVMMTAEVPLVSCFGMLYLGEPLSWGFSVGALLILGSSIGLNLLPTKSTLD
ncbi:MAG TPA: DMT family transporter [Desulfobacterales bacterium]|nr:DMT family transporter [Desulfobacterales bacterium]